MYQSINKYLHGRKAYSIRASGNKDITFAQGTILIIIITPLVAKLQFENISQTALEYSCMAIP